MKTTIGCDEAGRGAWAGPLVAAAVCLKRGKKFDHPLIRDSKKLSAKQRQEVFVYLQTVCQVGLGIVTVSEINRYGLQKANVLAVERAIMKLRIKNQELRIHIDHIGGFKNYTRLKRNYSLHTFGESRFPEIAAASIIAKVTRDRLMHRLAGLFPRYGFDRHKGYGTSGHYQSLQSYGLTDEHRRSFEPIERIKKGFRAMKADGTPGAGLV